MGLEVRDEAASANLVQRQQACANWVCPLPEPQDSWQEGAIVYVGRGRSRRSIGLGV